MHSLCQQAGPHHTRCPILNIPPCLQDHELNKSFPSWLQNLHYSVTATEHELRNGNLEDHLAVLCFHVWQMIILGSENFFRLERIIENKEWSICWSVYGETVPRVMSCHGRGHTGGTEMGTRGAAPSSWGCTYVAQEAVTPCWFASPVSLSSQLRMVYFAKSHFDFHSPIHLLELNF